VSEVDDGNGQEDPDSLARRLLGMGNEVWIKRDRMNGYIINRIRSPP